MHGARVLSVAARIMLVALVHLRSLSRLFVWRRMPRAREGACGCEHGDKNTESPRLHTLMFEYTVHAPVTLIRLFNRS